MKKVIQKNQRQTRRKRHIRKRISGTGERPRMTVFKSNKHIYVQVIDDQTGSTIAAASTNESGTRNEMKKGLEGGMKLGELVGKRLVEKNVKTVVFDRNGFKYHGIIKAVADGTRKAGIEF